MEYYSDTKRKTFESVLVWCIEPVIQSEESQKKKNKYHVNTHTYVCVCVYIYIYIYMHIYIYIYIWNLEEMVLMNLFTRQK